MEKIVLHDGDFVVFNNEDMFNDFIFTLAGKFPWTKAVEYTIKPKRFYLVMERTKDSKKKWRPEGWINPYRLMGNGYDNPQEEERHNIYESAADAMLEGLKVNGIGVTVNSNGGLNVLPESFPYVLSHFTRGKLVFIPKEV